MKSTGEQLRLHDDTLVLQALDSGPLSEKAIAKKTKVPLRRVVYSAMRLHDAYRIETYSRLSAWRLSKHERDGMAPNLVYVLGALREDGPTRVDEFTEWQRDALDVLRRRRLVEDAGCLVYRVDQPGHAKRARKLARALCTITAAMKGLRQNDKTLVLGWFMDAY